MSISDVLHTGGIVYEPPMAKLTVSEIERLAKAGVTMTFSEIAAQVVPDYMTPPNELHVDPMTLEESFWQRWRRAHLPDPLTFRGDIAPYKIHCHERGDTVFIMVCPEKEDPFIVFDEAILYPSDALMAKLALYEKVKP